MSFVTHLACKECGRQYPDGRHYVCDDCFGPLEVCYDYQKISATVNPALIERRPRNLWRYAELLPVTHPATGFYSGFTPLVRARQLEQKLGMSELYIKDDSANPPTFSYKERVVSVAVSRAIELGYDTLACASTGNLGNSVAAHAARTGLRCFVFIPADLESGKILGSAIYQPTLVGIDGNYDDVNRLCTQIGEEFNWAFANINLRPYYTEGAKTFGFEIAEQLGWRLPRHVVLPTAGGTLLPKVAKGFGELKQLGWVADTPCQIHSAQAQGCAPVVQALKDGASEITPVKPRTLAKSIAIGNPADGPYALQAVRESGGTGEWANDEEIVAAIELLARTEGIFTEPAGGATLAAAIKLIRSGRIGRDESTVIGITGNGYKTPEVFSERLRVPHRIGARLGEFTTLYDTLFASAAKEGQ